MFILRIVSCLIVGMTCLVARPLPDDLMVEGKPVHPGVVLSTQFGDSSRFEPKRIDVERVDKDNEFLKVVNEEYHYDEAAGAVVSKQEYEWGGQKGEWGPLYIVEEYEYEGTFGDKHLIHGLSYDTSATGRFGFLSLVKREGDNLINVGEIAAGDRGHGGYIIVESLENGILRYKQGVQQDEVIRLLGAGDIGVGFPPVGHGAFVVFEVDLGSEPVGTQYQSKVVGLDFEWLNDQYVMYPDAQVMNPFEDEAYKYIKEGKIRLSIEDSMKFGHKVMARRDEFVLE